jgi:hypothetical protein
MTDREETTSLYIHLYFDEDVSAGVIKNLRTRGFDVLSTHEADMLGKSDDEQMLCAISFQRAILTHNRSDFESQHKKFIEHGLKHYGIIIAKRRKDAEVVAKMLNLLDTVTAEEMENQLRYI